MKEKEELIEYNQPIKFKDKIIKDIVWSPAPCVTWPTLYQTEKKCFLTFNAVRKGTDGYWYRYMEDEKEYELTAIVEIKLCLCTKFGYPNDEALSGHPLRGKGLLAYSILKVLNSSWISELELQNRVNFLNNSEWINKYSHFVFTFHDSTFECICDGFDVTLCEESYKKVRKKIISQMEKI